MINKNLKELQQRLKKEVDKASILKIEAGHKQREYQNSLNLIRELQNSIDGINEKGIIVSDHAIVRYIERVKKMDIEQLKKEILTDDVMLLISQLGGNGSYPAKEFSIKIKDNVVVTVI